MNKPDSQQRIRQVAVVLTTVDEATARRLLGQFPASRARLIRQQMLRLGNVSPREREEAMRIFQQISGGKTPPKQKSESTPSNQYAGYINDSLSPAEAALMQQGDYQDRLDVSQNYPGSSPLSSPSFASHEDSYPPYETTGALSDAFQPIGHGLAPFAQMPAYPVWHNYTGEQLAQMLAGERPIVIAAVVQQAPTALGSAILQAMPVPLASATLAALPQLQTTDATVLQDIYGLLHERLAEFHRQSNPDNQGMMKLSALLTTIPADYRKRVEESLATTQPLLAHSLGISRTELLASKLDGSSSVSTSPPTSVPSEQTPATKTTPVADVTSEPSSPMAGSEMERHPSHDDELENLQFDQLADLPLPDFALVLRQSEPGTILVALASASKRTVQRIESMIDPKDLKRLRAQVASLKRKSKSEGMEAQVTIARIAVDLMRDGTIMPIRSQVPSKVLLEA